MNEKEFSQKIARTLNWGLSNIQDDKLNQLRAARAKALTAYRPPVNVLGLATVSGRLFDISYWARRPQFWLPAIMVAAVIATYTLSMDDGDDEVGELDAQLLTGELPIDAFLDKDFGSWVKESSEQ
ncbi:MAG: DUF3619 family protein [Betaproteobacteria bacterium]|nr:DUF3619 family protein [Betaproteobacteria bacterium]